MKIEFCQGCEFAAIFANGLSITCTAQWKFTLLPDQLKALEEEKAKKSLDI